KTRSGALEAPHVLGPSWPHEPQPGRHPRSAQDPQGFERLFLALAVELGPDEDELERPALRLAGTGPCARRHLAPVVQDPDPVGADPTLQVERDGPRAGGDHGREPADPGHRPVTAEM